MPQRSRTEWLLSTPSLAWMLVLFAWPAAVLSALSFRPADATGGVGAGWTLDAWHVLLQPGFQDILWRTLGISVAVTLFCVALALPVAWRISRASASRRHWLLLLVMLPFWTSFLIRVYAWRVLLQSSGPLSSFLQWLGVIDDQTMLLYNPASVVVVMVYTCLPLAVLPIYAAMEKFDPALLDAARDLGASTVRTFFRVVLPSIRGGIVAAALIVGIPCLGSYVVPDMIGGLDAEMLGNKIGQRLFSDRNLPQAAALASSLALVAMPAVLLAIRRRGHEED